jgi:hypothetical protein
MVRKTMKCLAGAFLIVAMLSCTKLSEREVPTGMEQGLKMEVSALGDSIPLKWGELVAVSSASQYSVVQLWFKDNEGNIYMVPYNTQTNTFFTNYKHIKRR